MTFLNASLLLGSIAIAVPIYLHLSGRRQPKKVVFGSLFLLQQTLRTTRTRVRLQQWWLLATRIIAILALAAALAAPAIASGILDGFATASAAMIVGVVAMLAATVMAVMGNRGRVAAGIAVAGLLALVGGGLGSAYAVARGPTIATSDGPLSLAIIIDNGPTSSQQTGETTALEFWKRQASTLANELPRGSRIAVLDRGGTEARLLSGRDAAITRIQGIEAVDVPASMPALIASANRVVSETLVDDEMPHVVVLTDRSISSWRPSPPPREVPVSKESVGGKATVIHVVAPEIEGDAAIVLSLPTATPLLPLPGSPIRITATVSMATSDEPNPSSTSPTREVSVEGLLYDDDPSLPVLRDGELILPSAVAFDRRLVSVSPTASAEVVLEIAGLHAGTHHAILRLSSKDSLALDDSRYISFDVRDNGEILVVCDDDDEAFVVQQVITDLCGGVTMIRSRDLPLVTLDDYVGVILLDPDASTFANDALAGWMRAGGSVMVALGPSAETGKSESPFWMPNLDRIWRIPDPGTFLRSTDTTGPISKSIGSDTPWIEFPVSKYWRVTATNDQGSNMRVLLSMAENSHPALVELTGSADSLGDGRAEPESVALVNLDNASAGFGVAGINVEPTL